MTELPPIGIEDRLSCWAYLMIVENMKRIGIPPVFPEKFSTQSIRRLLAQPLPSHQKLASSVLLWSIPTVLSTVQPSTPPKAMGTDRLLEPQRLASPAAGTGKDKLRAIRRSGFKFRRRKSLREENEMADDYLDVLQDPTGVDDVPVFEYEDPDQYLPPPLPIAPTMRPYINHVVQEFTSELEQYKVWVISGKMEVPPMHIPASPLDTNVDVPLDDD
ncbi:hypothetical protein GNI_005220 [Gregarina niphandrodes]|uniref:Uncharacterized protein n=1 Tax=Gregarina niphandrodes TaxID=110365 RepID=A0A023BDD3_GRENI|nr:hypothetical protein GNI_005220 [Gregarina niphandrodes]EZG88174.1 hypothetical protein GNI_005220 [Gregarina niphandrodes]|eukprot:XP_011128598.1 hypothetical protein GNI_005220 [Gregarina niphandrodes]